MYPNFGPFFPFIITPHLGGPRNGQYFLLASHDPSEIDQMILSLIFRFPPIVIILGNSSIPLQFQNYCLANSHSCMVSKLDTSYHTILIWLKHLPPVPALTLHPTTNSPSKWAATGADNQAASWLCWLVKHLQSILKNEDLGVPIYPLALEDSYDKPTPLIGELKIVIN